MAGTNQTITNAWAIWVDDGAVRFDGQVTANAGLSIADAQDIALATGTGTIIATAVTQKLGFWGVTPVIQPVSADQGDQGTMTTAGANPTASGAGLTDLNATFNNVEVEADLKALQEDIAALDVLLTAVRTALVDTGIMKGAA